VSTAERDNRKGRQKRPDKNHLFNGEGKRIITPSMGTLRRYFGQIGIGIKYLLKRRGVSQVLQAQQKGDGIWISMMEKMRFESRPSAR
jgi:hypothetical protein